MDKHPLKPGWTRVKFGDVVRLNSDRIADPVAAGIERYVGLEHIDPEDLRLRRWGLVADGITFTNLFRPGQTLFGKRRAYQRKVAVADFEGVCSGDIYVFETQDPTRLLPELLAFVCQTERFLEYAVGTSAGSLSPRTNWTHLAQFEFALPPLDEQRVLAEVLWKFQNAQTALVELRAASDRLTPILSAEFLTPRADWENILLGEVAQVSIDRVALEPHKNYPLAGVLGLGQGLFENGQVNVKSTKYKFLHRLHADQLVLRKITAWESPIAIVTRDFDGAFVSPEFPTFSLDVGRIIPSFMSILYKTPQFRREMQARCIGTLVRRKRLYPEALLKIPITLPPLAEQKRIVSQLNGFTSALSLLWKRQELLRTGRKAIIESVLDKSSVRVDLTQGAFDR